MIVNDDSLGGGDLEGHNHSPIQVNTQNLSLEGMEGAGAGGGVVRANPEHMHELCLILKIML